MQIFIQTQEFSTNTISVDVEPTTTFKDVFDEIIQYDETWSIDDCYYFSLIGGDIDYFDIDQKLSETNEITSECILKLKQLPKEHQVLSAFKNTNAEIIFKNWDIIQFPDCCHDQWEGIRCDDQNENVIQIRLQNSALKGNVNLSKLPQTLQWLQLWGSALKGRVDFTRLPKSLQMLYLEGNELSGTVDLTKLPHSLIELMLQHNQFDGNLDLTKLPSTLKVLDLGYNQLVGKVNLTQLPQSIQQIWLQNNNFNGKVDLTKLPQSLICLVLTHNQFEGYCGQRGRTIHLDDYVQNVDELVVVHDDDRLHLDGNMKIFFVVIIICIFFGLWIYRCIINGKQEKHQRSNQTTKHCNDSTV